MYYFSSNPAASSQVSLAIKVNGAVVSVEAATFTAGTLDTSTIVKLRAGDDVYVEFNSSEPGFIAFSTATHFEGILNRVTK